VAGKSESHYFVFTIHRQKPVGFFKKPTGAKKAESFSKSRRHLFDAKNRQMSQL
jgi:hypothetical protein